MTLHILGAGSIGLLYAANMRKHFTSYPIVLLIRKAHRHKLFQFSDGAKYILYSRTKLTSIDGSSYNVDIPSEIIGENNEQNINSILVTTKAFQAATALEAILPRIDKTKQTNIIIMTNGCLSVSNALREVLLLNEIPNFNILHASCTHGAGPPDEYVHNDDDRLGFHVVHKGLGRTFLENSPISEELEKVWSLCGLECKLLSPTEMYIMNWKKLAANCVINPLSALRKCKNGLLLQDINSFCTSRNSHVDHFDYESLSMAEQILMEVSEVALSTTSLIAHTNISQEDLWKLSLKNLRSFVKDVIIDTKDNKSSMLIDVLKGRETEISCLNGYVAKLGREQGIDTSANQYIVDELEKLKSCKPFK